MITTGIKFRLDEVVTPEKTASAIGSGLVEVYATPMMIALIERTCSESLLPYLEEGQATVGTHLDVAHSAATPVGAEVWCESELVEVDGRRLLFRVEAHDKAGVIGSGTHERFIVGIDRFMSKAHSRMV